MEIAERYAEYATSLKFEDLPAEVVDHTKKLILDIMANDIGGHDWMELRPEGSQWRPRAQPGRKGRNGPGQRRTDGAGMGDARQRHLRPQPRLRQSPRQGRHPCRIVGGQCGAGRRRRERFERQGTDHRRRHRLRDRLPAGDGARAPFLARDGFSPDWHLRHLRGLGDHRAAARHEPRRNRQRHGPQRFAGVRLDAICRQRRLEQARPSRHRHPLRLHRRHTCPERIHRRGGSVRGPAGLPAGLRASSDPGAGDANAGQVL